MTARRTDTHRIQELIRLHRLGESSRSIARQLRMSRDAIRAYRRALATAGLLDGPAEVVPELGFRQLSRQEASLFFRLVSWRYQKGSTLITTNKAVKDWPEVFAGDEVMVTALLDRLLHRCHAFNIKGRSYLLRELEQQFK